MGEKQDWRNAGAQIERERAELQAVIDAIPESMSTIDIKNEIYDSMKPFVKNDPMIDYVSKLSNQEARRLLGECRYVKRKRE